MTTHAPAASPGPAIEAAIEAPAIEVTVYWEDAVLAVEQLSVPASFIIGEADDCDFHVAGVERQVIVDASTTLCVGAEEEVTHDALRFVLRGVEPEARHGAKLRFNKRGALGMFASAAAQLGLLMGTAAFMPAMSHDSDDMLTEDQHYLMSQYLEAAAHMQEEAEDVVPVEGGGDVALDADEGTADDPNGTPGVSKDAVRNGGPRYYAPGPAGPVSRAEALQDAADFGMITMLRAAELGNVPSPWAVPLGDSPSVGIFDPSLQTGSDPFGGEIGLTRPQGDGSDAGPGGWYGTRIGDVFGPNGPGNCRGINCRGLSGRQPRLTRRSGFRHPRGEAPKQDGVRLPPGAIQRVVHANFGRFRACYQSGLRSNPALAGRVAVSFVISRDGTVVSARSSGSDLPDAGVVSCVVGAFSALTFTAPEDGIVKVTYPIVFMPSQV